MAQPFLGIYSGEIKADDCLHKNLYTMLTAALFITAKTWKPSKCPSASERINVVYSYNGMLLSHREKYDTTSTCDNID